MNPGPGSGWRAQRGGTGLRILVVFFLARSRPLSSAAAATGGGSDPHCPRETFAFFSMR